MQKVLLLDIDGVIIKPRDKKFTERIVADFNVTQEDAQQFYTNALKPALLGEIDLADVLPAYLQKWNIDKTVDDLFEYWWAAEDNDDKELIGYVQQLRSTGVRVYLASDQEKNRAEYLMKRYESLFDGAFISCRLGVKKSEPEFFRLILEDLNIDNPSTIQFWDDDETNTKIAKELGIDARIFTGIKEFKQIVLR